MRGLPAVVVVTGGVAVVEEAVIDDFNFEVSFAFDDGTAEVVGAAVVVVVGAEVVLEEEMAGEAVELVLLESFTMFWNSCMNCKRKEDLQEDLARC